MAAAKWFPERLQEIREQHGLTQQELADKIGVKQVTVARWEVGMRAPSWESVLAICEALGVSCEAFRQPPKPKKKD